MLIDSLPNTTTLSKPVPLIIICSMSSLSRLSLLGLLLLITSFDTVEVSAWVPALRNNLPRTTLSTNPHYDLTRLYATVQESTETVVVDSSISSQEEEFTVQLPKIQYTIPGMKLGWKENGVWMDEDGPRDGPPQNYWRQAADERLHKAGVDVIKNILKQSSLEEDIDVSQNDALNEIILRVERQNTIRIPCLNRMVLGNWAPIVRGGKVVGSSTGEEESADIPYQLQIQRTAGQKLAPKTNYGIFDEHLEPGEDVTVQELSSSNIVTATGTFLATSDKDANELVEGYKNAKHGDLYVGGITYLTKYIMIMREQVREQDPENEENPAKGSVTEVWMRIDPK